MDSNRGENISLEKLLNLYYVCKHLEFVNDDDVYTAGFSISILNSNKTGGEL